MQTESAETLRRNLVTNFNPPKQIYAGYSAMLRWEGGNINFAHSDLIDAQCSLELPDLPQDMERSKRFAVQDITRPKTIDNLKRLLRMAQLPDEFELDLRRLPDRLIWERGMLSGVTLTLDEWKRFGKLLMANNPIRRIQLLVPANYTYDDLNNFIKSCESVMQLRITTASVVVMEQVLAGAFQQLEILELNYFGSTMFSINPSPAKFPKLRSLGLSATKSGMDLCSIVVGLPAMKNQLTALYTNGFIVDPDSYRGLFRGHLPKLQYLSLNGFDIDHDTLAIIGTTKLSTYLKAFKLSYCDNCEIGLTINTGTSYPTVKHLALLQMTGPFTNILAGARTLETLCMRWSALDDEQIDYLTGKIMPACLNLQSLMFSGEFSDNFVRAISNCDKFSKVKNLVFQSPYIDPAVAKTVFGNNARYPHLRNLIAAPGGPTVINMIYDEADSIFSPLASTSVWYNNVAKHYF